MPTPEAEKMAEVVAEHAPLLKAEGFKKRRHSFNRQMESGLVHVVNFWQHPKEPPAWTEVPGLRERRYGTFRLDFGVYVPQIRRTGSPRSEWINEYNCHLRRTIGQLQGSREDLWWPLDDGRSIELARRGLERDGLPWLSRFADHDDVLEAFRTGGPFPIGMSPAGGLDLADMLYALGRKREAREILEEYVAKPVLRSHADYLANYLRNAGQSDLVERITTKDPGG